MEPPVRFHAFSNNTVFLVVDAEYLHDPEEHLRIGRCINGREFVSPRYEKDLTPIRPLEKPEKELLVVALSNIKCGNDKKEVPRIHRTIRDSITHQFCPLGKNIEMSYLLSEIHRFLGNLTGILWASNWIQNEKFQLFLPRSIKIPETWIAALPPKFAVCWHDELPASVLEHKHKDKTREHKRDNESRHDNNESNNDGHNATDANEPEPNDENNDEADDENPHAAYEKAYAFAYKEVYFANEIDAGESKSVASSKRHVEPVAEPKGERQSRYKKKQKTKPQVSANRGRTCDTGAKKDFKVTHDHDKGKVDFKSEAKVDSQNEAKIDYKHQAATAKENKRDTVCTSNQVRKSRNPNMYNRIHGLKGDQKVSLQISTDNGSILFVVPRKGWTTCVVFCKDEDVDIMLDRFNAFEIPGMKQVPFTIALQIQSISKALAEDVLTHLERDEFEHPEYNYARPLGYEAYNIVQAKVWRLFEVLKRDTVGSHRYRVKVDDFLQLHQMNWFVHHGLKNLSIEYVRGLYPPCYVKPHFDFIDDNRKRKLITSQEYQALKKQKLTASVPQTDTVETKKAITRQYLVDCLSFA